MQPAETQQRHQRRPLHPFDSLAYAKSMESVGFTRQQAEKMAEEQAKLIDERLATKEDIYALQADIEALRLSTKADIETNAASTKAEILKWVLGAIGLQTLSLLGGMIAIIRTMH